MTLRPAWLLIACLSLAACGATPPRVNPLLEQAQRLRSDAGRAFERLDYAAAARDFAAAVKLRASVDDLPGAALDRLSLARALAAARQADAAQAQLDAVLAQEALPKALRAEAARQQAVLALAQDRRDQAQAWQQRARHECGDACPLAASLALIRAQIALRQGDALTAASETAMAQKLLGAEGSASPEQANAARLAGEIAMQRKDWAEARKALEQALAIDRELGSAERVRRDLLLLATSDEAAADLSAARSRYQRLLAAAEAGGDHETTAFARAALKRLAE